MFIRYANIVLGGLLGVLIAIPVSSEAPFQLILGLVLGALVGYRRRDSRLFMYMTIVFVLILSSLIYYYSMKGELAG